MVLHVERRRPDRSPGKTPVGIPGSAFRRAETIGTVTVDLAATTIGFESTTELVEVVRATVTPERIQNCRPWQTPSSHGPNVTARTAIGPASVEWEPHTLVKGTRRGIGCCRSAGPPARRLRTTRSRPAPVW